LAKRKAIVSRRLIVLIWDNTLFCVQITQMKVDKSLIKVSGIYYIKNIVNGKLYIGQSVNIYTRLLGHIRFLNNRNLKQENSHFINAWHKYNKECFECGLLEEISDRNLFNAREEFWIRKYDTINRSYGYNLRIDDCGYVCHAETRLKLSNAGKRWGNTVENKEKTSQRFSKFWKDNPEKKREMAKKVSISKQKYDILQFDKKGETLIKTWNSVQDIIDENPGYKWQNIYSVCNGYKKRIYGYVWKKQLKI
jgi:group I intron endonuclease